MIIKKLKLFFGVLKKNKVKYAFLRSYDDFLDGHIDKDLDIVIDWNHKSKFEDSLFKHFNDKSTTVYIKGIWETAIQYRIFNFQTKEKIILDVRKDYTFNGKKLINNQALIQNIRSYKSIFILNKKIENEMLVYHIFFKKRFKKRYKMKLKELNILEEKFIKKLFNNIINLDDLENIFTDIKNKLNKSENFLNKILYKISSFFIVKKSLHIVLLGPDGSGKSTIGFEIEKIFLMLGLNANYFHYSRGRNSMLKKKKYIEPKISEKKKKLKNLFPKNLFFIYRFLHHVKKELIFLGIFFRYNNHYSKTIIENKKNKKISIIDRFPLNSCIDKKKLQYYSITRHFLSLLIKPPRKVYFLHADENIIYKRKQELNINQIKQFMKYEKNLIIKKNIDYKVIDVNKNIDEVAFEIVRDLTSCFRNETMQYKL